jgi:hypothetical protein
MPAATDLTGLAGIALALTAVPLALPAVRHLSRLRLAGLLAAVAFLVLAPLGPLPVVIVVRGATGDLSITTLVLLGGAILRGLTGWPPVDPRSRWVLLSLVAVAALALYPMALGLGMYDPYRLGYASPWLLGGALAVALAAWFRRLDHVALCLALATLAWTMRWHESTNLWDYLIDPLVSLYALGALAVLAAKQLPRRVPVSE